MTENCAFSVTDASGPSLRVEFAGPGQTVPVNFRLLSSPSAESSLAWTAEAQAASGLVPAMRSGLPLRIDGLLEPVFHRNLGVVQDLLGFWCKDLNKIAIEAGLAATARRPAEGRQALFFGGGVDSMFTLLRCAGDITDLIYVHGYDVPLAETELRDSVSHYLRQVATQFGINLIEIETDFRVLLDANISWQYSHGAALAAVAHLLSNHFRRIYISSTYSYGKLLPCGSHPMLDPLWSTSTLEFVHEGADVSRADKVASVARNANARRWLRVCWMAPRADRLNCCRCEKCLRTMVALHAVGELHADEAFSLRLDLVKVAAMKLTDITRDLWHENHALLLATGRDRKLLAVIERLLEPSSFKRVRRRIRQLNHRRLAERNQSTAKEGQ